MGITARLDWNRGLEWGILGQASLEAEETDSQRHNTASRAQGAAKEKAQ